ncbi:putative guanosine-3',5'-bis(diphosphate) 3'-diphosphatase [Dioscorea sansibarensis]
MASCKELGHRSSAILGRSALKLFPFPCLRGSLALRRRAPGGLSVTSSLGPVIGSAAAVASGGSHAAVTSTLAHVAVTAVAIASGACLSTKVDFLWPRAEQMPDSFVLDGVDVTGYPIFKEEKVQQAIAFANKAHHGQFRKTGDPCITHCIHTGKILAALVPSTGERAVNTVVAGILHDVVDDTIENLSSIEEHFGDDVAHLVAGVSRLSYVNQLLRRHRRNSFSESSLDPDEANNLRIMLLGMVDDPRVVLIKLADRLHNMRTIYALSLPKAHAVAQETLSIWCSLASRLGVWALKAEMEDLCFAVLQPHTFQIMRAELSSMWHPNNRTRNLRRLSTKAGFIVPLQDTNSIPNHDLPVSTNEERGNMRDLLQAVLPFDLLLDRRKRTSFLDNLKSHSDAAGMKSEVVNDVGIALGSLAVCEEALEQELLISNPYIPGMEITLSSRLKSLYSIYCKMKRKDINIRQVYDARALRVVVGDKNGKLHGPAVKICYSLLDIIHRLWTPIDGEFDDYIVNPKPSGYQSLHTAVLGPDSSPLEVQIRTQRMHEYAEFGLAAHWLYKESKVETAGSMHDPKIKPSTYETNFLGDEAYVEDSVNNKYASLKVGHPVLRVEGSQLLAAVIVRVDKGGRELLVAVSFDLEASESVAERRSSIQKKHWEDFAKLYKKVSDQWWFAPGHGDWCTCLEKYTLSRDGIFHKEDQFQRLLPTFIQVLDLTEKEEAEYWMVLSAVFEGKQILSVSSDLANAERSRSESFSYNSTEDGINNKVYLLRTMLQWEEQVRHGATLGPRKHVTTSYGKPNPVSLSEVVIIRWPHGEIMRMRSGSTAADAAQRIGLEGKLVLVNGQLALPHTELKDGDIVEIRL